MTKGERRQPISNPEFPKPETLFLGEVIARDKIRLREFFGYPIDVPPLPAGITQKQYDEWKKNGFDLSYLPPVYLSQGKRFPGWKVMPKDEFYRVSRVTALYAEHNRDVAQGRTIPQKDQLPGSWVLFDTRQKPAKDDGDQMYPDDILSPTLAQLRKTGVIEDYKNKGSRFNLSWKELHKREVIHAITKILNVHPSLVALPRYIELNFLGNLLHPEWGETDTSEWVEDIGLGTNSGARYICSNDLTELDSMGYDDWIPESKDTRSTLIGFRPLIIFSGEYSPYVDTIAQEIESYKKQLGIFFSQWKNEWVSTGSGPMKINIYTRSLLPPEQLEAEKQEEKAYVALVDFCARSIHQSAQSDTSEKILRTTSKELRFHLNDKSASIKFDLLGDIFAQTITMMHKEIADLKMKERTAYLGRQLAKEKQSRELSQKLEQERTPTGRVPKKSKRSSDTQ